MPDLMNLQELLTALNLQILAMPRYEADDIIGTLARKATNSGFRVKILSGDRDLFQLVDPDGDTSVLYMSTTYGKGTPPPREFGSEQVKEKLGVLPSQVVDFKALCGDASDNIPGVKGIGEKTAVQLLTEFGNLKQIYASLDKVKGAVRKKLEEGRDDAMRSQYLAQIHLDVPIEADLEAFKLQEINDEAVVPLLEKLEFNSFLSKIRRLHRQFDGSSDEGMDDAKAATISPPRYEDPDLWFLVRRTRKPLRKKFQ